ncbi:helix-turn-helix domain-containing protein [Sporosarcina sp. ACRSL]|uniref:helix-turn-helix domain-containing protein n=1 Tax=Sporosarcina sp. ACRSL TaxID=2918215 RepID=UPI001EF5F450|nr:helix-turn-helix transcriptional regulator [Sporosarcina sp. ACRSL]MCG7346081.1 helix-turn-helix domain-containing protein [Sporosarcina sp. ACRSL]
MQFNHYKLKAARCLKGYSVEEMARRTGIDTHAYWRMESGKTQLKVQYFLKIATVLNQPLTYFIEESELLSDVTDRVTELRILLDRLDSEGKEQYLALIKTLDTVCTT